jgi:hypothetical protein
MFDLNIEIFDASRFLYLKQLKYISRKTDAIKFLTIKSYIIYLFEFQFMYK